MTNWAKIKVMIIQYNLIVEEDDIVESFWSNQASKSQDNIISASYGIKVILIKQELL